MRKLLKRIKLDVEKMYLIVIGIVSLYLIGVCIYNYVKDRNFESSFLEIVLLLIILVIFEKGLKLLSEKKEKIKPKKERVIGYLKDTILISLTITAIQVLGWALNKFYPIFLPLGIWANNITLSILVTIIATFLSLGLIIFSLYMFFGEIVFKKKEPKVVKEEKKTTIKKDNKNKKKVSK